MGAHMPLKITQPATVALGLEVLKKSSENLQDARTERPLNGYSI